MLRTEEKLDWVNQSRQDKQDQSLLGKSTPMVRSMNKSNFSRIKGKEVAQMEQSSLQVTINSMHFIPRLWLIWNLTGMHWKMHKIMTLNLISSTRNSDGFFKMLLSASRYSINSRILSNNKSKSKTIMLRLQQHLTITTTTTSIVLK